MFLIVINTTSGGTRVRGAGAVPAGGRQLQFAGPPPPAVARRTAWSSTGRRFHSARAGLESRRARAGGGVRRPASAARPRAARLGGPAHACCCWRQSRAGRAAHPPDTRSGGVSPLRAAFFTRGASRSRTPEPTPLHGACQATSRGILILINTRS